MENSDPRQFVQKKLNESIEVIVEQLRIQGVDFKFKSLSFIGEFKTVNDLKEVKAKSILEPELLTCYINEQGQVVCK